MNPLSTLSIFSHGMFTSGTLYGYGTIAFDPEAAGLSPTEEEMNGVKQLYSERVEKN